MLRVTLKGVRGHILRFLLTVVSVMLGTALIAGTYVLTDSINATFNKIFDQASKGLDVQVRGLKGGQVFQGGQDIRQPLPLTLADRLRQVDGVARVVPDLQGTAILVGKNGTAIRNGGAPTFAFAFRADDPVVKLVAGRGPESAGEVAVESSTLKLSGLKVGDHTPALIGGQPSDVAITGEVSFDAELAGATLVLLDPATAQSQFAPDGTVQSFTLTATPGVSADQLREHVSGVLPTGAEAVTGATVAKESKDSISQALGFINTFLLVFAGISLFVGAFIIYNTFSMLIAQRTRELALLRAVGASRGQVLRVVLGEGLVVGLLGGLGGLGLGLGMASALQAFFASIGLDITGLPVLPRTVVVSLLAAVMVTLLAALIPALRATRIPPVAAMRDDIITAPKSLRRRGIVGIVMLAVGILLVVLAVNRTDVAWWNFLAGAVLLVVGSLVAAPLVTRPVVRVVAAPFVATSGTIGRLARENALRVPRRTATTASALMIGLAVIAALSVVAESTRASTRDLVERQLTADFVLNGGQAPFPPTVAEATRKLPGVASVATVGAIPVDVSGNGLIAVAGDATGLSQNVKLDVTAGKLTALDAGQVLVSTGTARARHWSVGSAFAATIGALRGENLTVGGIYKDNAVLGGQTGMIVPHALYQHAVPAAQQGDFLVYVKAAPGTDLAALRQSLVAEVKPFLVVSVQDGKEFTDAEASRINVILYLMYGLVVFSIIIAIMGIINTLALSVFERTREIGLLRAVGLARGQLSRMITIEAVATAVFGAVLGTALGLGLGIALWRGLRDSGLGVLAISWGTLVFVLIAAAIAGVVAAVLPAIRAVRLDVLRAITTE